MKGCLFVLVCSGCSFLQSLKLQLEVQRRNEIDHRPQGFPSSTPDSSTLLTEPPLSSCDNVSRRLWETTPNVSPNCQFDFSALNSMPESIDSYFDLPPWQFRSHASSASFASVTPQQQQSLGLDYMSSPSDFSPLTPGLWSTGYPVPPTFNAWDDTSDLQGQEEKPHRIGILDQCSETSSLATGEAPDPGPRGPSFIQSKDKKTPSGRIKFASHSEHAVHNHVERRYRRRLCHAYECLRSALPPNREDLKPTMAERTVELEPPREEPASSPVREDRSGGGLERSKKLSKAELLDSAVSHISDLEGSVAREQERREQFRRRLQRLEEEYLERFPGTAEVPD
jgi:hypothetical protein